MQEEIVKYLKEKYQPAAIILHGSRARGRARVSSDWDFILLHTDTHPYKTGREVFKDQNIERVHKMLPVHDILKEFTSKLQGAVVTYEKNSEGTGFLKEANLLYKEGVNWTKEEISNHRLWFEGRIEGMKGSISDPVVFEKYFADLYQRVSNYWYWVKQKSYSQPIYVAADEIAQCDPEYYEMMKKLASTDISAAEKVFVAEQIMDYLFT